MPVWVIAALVGLGVGVGGTAVVGSIFGRGDAKSIEATAEVVEAVQAPAVESEHTDQQVTETERLVAFCDPEAATYDERACLAMQVCQLGVASGPETVKVCDEAINIWISVEGIEKCEAFVEDDARDRCYSWLGKRK